jgi:hypothetical protein
VELPPQQHQILLLHPTTLPVHGRREQGQVRNKVRRPLMAAKSRLPLLGATGSGTMPSERSWGRVSLRRYTNAGRSPTWVSIKTLFTRVVE